MTLSANRHRLDARRIGELTPSGVMTTSMADLVARARFFCPVLLDRDGPVK